MPGLDCGVALVEGMIMTHESCYHLCLAYHREQEVFNFRSKGTIDFLYAKEPIPSLKRVPNAKLSAEPKITSYHTFQLMKDASIFLIMNANNEKQH